MKIKIDNKLIDTNDIYEKQTKQDDVKKTKEKEVKKTAIDSGNLCNIHFPNQQ